MNTIPPARFVIEQTDAFARWLAGLRDLRARIAVGRRIERMTVGNFGDAKPVGGGISELRINTGPGYRVYFILRQQCLVILLCGGGKRTQRSDIQRAQQMAEENWS